MSATPSPHSTENAGSTVDKFFDYFLAVLCIDLEKTAALFSTVEITELPSKPDEEVVDPSESTHPPTTEGGTGNHHEENNDSGTNVPTKAALQPPMSATTNSCDPSPAPPQVAISGALKSSLKLNDRTLSMSQVAFDSDVEMCRHWITENYPFDAGDVRIHILISDNEAS